MCALVPLLPVKQTTATIQWPQAATPTAIVGDITAPLVSGAPRVTRRVHPVPDGGHPARRRRSGVLHDPARRDRRRPQRPVRARQRRRRLSSRSVTSVAAVAPRDAVESGACSTIHLWANVGAVGADFVGIPGATGTLAPDKRPQVAGIFTDLNVPTRSRRDSARSTSTPGSSPRRPLLKTRGDGARRRLRAGLDRRARAAGPRRRVGASRAGLASRRRAGLSTWLTDAGVVGALLVWHLVGAAVLGRRLQPDHRPGVRGRRLHRQLLPLLRRLGSPVRLVSERAGAPGLDQHRRRLDAAARHRGRDRHLADPEPLRAAAARQAAGPQPGRGVDRGRGVPGRVAAVQQRPAPRTADRVRRGRGVDARRERSIGTRRLWPVAAAIVIAVFSRDPRPAGPDRAGAAAGRRPRRHPRHLRPPRDRRAARPSWPRWPAAASLVFVVVFRDQTLATVAESVAHQVRRRADHPLVPGVPALLLPDRRGQRRRLADPPLRGADPAAVPVRPADGAAAPRQRAGRGQRTRVAADRHHRDRAAAADAHPDQVGDAVRRVRRPGGRAGRASPRSRSPASGCTADATWRCT